MRKASKFGLALIASAAAAVGGLATGASADSSGAFVDGGFESAAVATSLQGGVNWQNYLQGDDIGGWSVSSGNVDLVQAPTYPALDSQAVDLNGFGPGAIQQSFNTVAGVPYTIGYWVNSNPSNDPSITVGDPSARVYSFDATGTLAVADDNIAYDTGLGGWQYHQELVQASVPATGNPSTAMLTFSGVNPGYAGVILDNVTVTAGSASTVVNTSPSQGSFTNNKATAVFHALVTSTNPACVAGRTVRFNILGLTPSGGLTAVTDASGLASLKLVVAPRSYDVTSSVGSTSTCGSSSDEDMISFAAKPAH